MMNKSKTFSELVSSTGIASVERIMRHGKQLRRMDNLLQSVLPSELQPHCQVANIKGRSIILAVGSTVWATRIRYQIPILINKLQKEEYGRGITDIQIRVQPEKTVSKREKPARKATMSREAALSVQHCAASVDDEKLRTALERLASRKTGN